MSFKRRLQNLERDTTPSNELAEQAKHVWGYIGIELSDSEAEHIATWYRDRGYKSITWASLMTIDPDSVRDFL